MHAWKFRFRGKWEFSYQLMRTQNKVRVVISDASVGSGVYEYGTLGATHIVDGKDYWTLEVQWQEPNGTWHPSLLIKTDMLLSPLRAACQLSSLGGLPTSPLGIIGITQLHMEHKGPLIQVLQKPFAVDASTFSMIPGGIFEAAAGIQYMGVRVENIWAYDFDDVMVQISEHGKQSLQSLGINILDSWSAQELEALGQEVNGDGDAVWVRGLRKDESRIVYFKLDCSGASPCKPKVPIVARRTDWDPVYDELERTVSCQIYVSNSHWDPDTGEVVVGIPEATLRMRVKRATVEPRGFWKAVREAESKGCLDAVTKLKSASRPTGSAGLREELQGFLQDLLEGKPVDPCKLRELMELCCHDKSGEPTKPRDTHLPRECSTFNPFYMLLDEFEYTIEYNTPFEGRYGPLAFEDPWWKVALIVVAILLIIAMIVLTFLSAVREAKAAGDIVIGKIHKIEPPNNEHPEDSIDAAVISLNGSRGHDIGVLDTTKDDVDFMNNIGLGSPEIFIKEWAGVIPLERWDNGNWGIADAEEGMVVFKSGATSGLTFGIVEDEEYDDYVSYFSDDYIYSYRNLIKIWRIEAENMESVRPWVQSQLDLDDILALPAVALPGDSGSVWVDIVSKRVVALLFAGPNREVVGSDASVRESTAIPIRRVCKKLKIQFNSPYQFNIT